MAASTGAVVFARHVGQEDVPGGFAMVALHQAVRLGERQPFEREAVVLHERMLLERRLRALGSALVELAALVGRALEKQRAGRCRHGPATLSRRMVERAAIQLGTRQ